MPQFGFIYDPLKCMGCHACAVACKAEQNTPVGVRFRRVVYRESGTFAGTGSAEVRRTFFSTACYHCANPACVGACPTGAANKDPTTGMVRINQAVCVGCRRCAAACPYGAPQFNAATAKTEKCSGCWNRVVDETAGSPAVRANVRPACVAACPARALRFEVRTGTWGAGTAPTGYYDRTKTNPSVDFE